MASNRVLNQDGLNHLIDRLDERYSAGASGITDEVIDSVLGDAYTPKDENAGDAGEGMTDAQARANSNAHEPKANRVLNYPGLVHLIPRLDKRYNRKGDMVYAATRLSVARQIAIKGDVLGDAMFDGTKDIEIGTAVEKITNTELEAMLT